MKIRKKQKLPKRKVPFRRQLPFYIMMTPGLILIAVLFYARAASGIAVGILRILIPWKRQHVEESMDGSYLEEFRVLL